MAVKRSTLVIGAIVLAAGIGLAAMKGLFGYPPNTSGTIGAAKRYQAGQLSGSDVQLSDAQMQAFLQTDTFRKMQTNAEFRKAVEGGLGKALAGGALGKIVTADGSLARLLTDPGFVGLTAKDDFGKVLTDDSFQRFVDGLSRNGALTGLEVGMAAEAAAVARDLQQHATELAKAAAAEKMFAAAKGATELASAAEAALVAAEAASRADAAKAAELDARFRTLAKQAETLSHSLESAKSMDVVAKTLAVSRNVDAMTRVSEGARTEVMSMRMLDLGARTGDLAKATESGRTVESEKALALTKEVTELSRAEDLGHSVVAAQRAGELAKQATELAHFLESAKALDAAGSADAAKAVVAVRAAADAAKAVDWAKAINTAARDVARSAESLASASEVARTFESARLVEATRATELTKLIESGSLSRDVEFTKAVRESGLQKSGAFTEMMKNVEFQKMLMSRDFQSLARLTEFGIAMTDASVLSLVRSPEFGRLLFDTDAQRFLAAPEAAAIARTPDFDKTFLTSAN